MRLENQSIICFASDSWGSIWRNRHQIMSRLAQTNRVLYVEPQTLPINKALLNLRRFSWKNQQVSHIANQLWVYRHPDWGFNSRWRIFDQLGLKFRISAIRHTLQKLQMSSPILWVVDPHQCNMIGHFEEILVCYHIVDNYTAAPWRSAQQRAVIEAAEQFMLSAAGLVIVTSPALFEAKKAHNHNVHLVRNGVDYPYFARAINNAKPPPPDIAAIPSPVIGYVGAVNNKLDYELLTVIARARPDWSLVLVGPISNQANARLEQFVRNHSANVYLLGQRDVTEVPYYIQACDVCLLPYCQDSYTQNIDSLKLYEYLACEKPIVATDIPAVREHNQAVYIATNEADFLHKIEIALTSPVSSEQQTRQRTIAMQNTWDQRVEQLSNLILQALPVSSRL